MPPADAAPEAWNVAVKAFEEGAVFTLSNTPLALRFGNIKDLSVQCNAEVIPADATSVKDLENVISRSMEVLGGKVDFILHSIGMSMNVRKSREYDDLDYDYFLKRYFSGSPSRSINSSA